MHYINRIDILHYYKVGNASDKNMNDNQKCSKCGGDMEQGVIIAIAGVVSSWGVKKSAPMGGYSVKDRTQITAYRCINCGYIENYAK